MNDLFRLFETF